MDTYQNDTAGMGTAMSIRDCSNLPDSECPEWVVRHRERCREIKRQEEACRKRVASRGEYLGLKVDPVTGKGEFIYGPKEEQTP